MVSINTQLELSMNKASRIPCTW